MNYELPVSLNMRIVPLLSLAIITVLLAPSISAQTDPAEPVCPVAGFTQVDYGTGSGWIAPMVAHYGMNAAKCSIDMKIEAFSCCNTYFQEFYLMYGEYPIYPGLALPEPPFWSLSELLVAPVDVIGPFSGDTGSVAIPNNPQLPGMTFYLQCLGVWTTFFVSFDYGVSQGTVITFF